MLGSILSWVNKQLGNILFFLPDSPFVKFIDSMEDLKELQYLNYFLPITEIIAIGQAWLVAIGIFYVYQAILRWVKAIE